MGDGKKRACQRCLTGTEEAIFTTFWTCDTCDKPKKEKELFISFEEADDETTDPYGGWEFKIDLGEEE